MTRPRDPDDQRKQVSPAADDQDGRSPAGVPSDAGSQGRIEKVEGTVNQHFDNRRMPTVRDLRELLTLLSEHGVQLSPTKAGMLVALLASGARLSVEDIIKVFVDERGGPSAEPGPSPVERPPLKEIQRALRRISEISDEGRCDHGVIEKIRQRCDVDVPPSCAWHEVTKMDLEEKIRESEVLHLSGGWDADRGQLVLKNGPVDLEEAGKHIGNIPRISHLLVINFYPGNDKLVNALKECFPLIVVWTCEVQAQLAEQFAEVLYHYLAVGRYGLAKAVNNAFWVLDKEIRARASAPEVIEREPELKCQEPFFTDVRFHEGSVGLGGAGARVDHVPGGGSAGPAAEEQLNPRKGV